MRKPYTFRFNDNEIKGLDHIAALNVVSRSKALRLLIRKNSGVEFEKRVLLPEKANPRRLYLAARDLVDGGPPKFEKTYGVFEKLKRKAGFSCARTLENNVEILKAQGFFRDRAGFILVIEKLEEV